MEYLFIFVRRIIYKKKNIESKDLENRAQKYLTCVFV